MTTARDDDNGVSPFLNALASGCATPAKHTTLFILQYGQLTPRLGCPFVRQT